MSDLPYVVAWLSWWYFVVKPVLLKLLAWWRKRSARLVVPAKAPGVPGLLMALQKHPVKKKSVLKSTLRDWAEARAARRN